MTQPFDDIGGDTNGNRYPTLYSYQNIITAAETSGLYGPDPLLRDTSDLRPFSDGFSYHFTGNAVDFGDDEPNGSPQQTAFANWVLQYFGPFTLELIHLNADNTYVAVKNGAVVPYSFYGDATMQAHRNHVHWAITNTGLLWGSQRMVDPFKMLGTINTNGPLNMQAPVVRTAQGLLEARGGMIKPDNVDHPVFSTVTKWFQQQAGLAQDGVIGPITWTKLTQPLNGK